MENDSQISPSSDWEWDENNLRVGKFQLRDSIEMFAEMIEKLERYPYESYATYLIRGTIGSKLFVKAKVISSIQCGDHFIVEGTDVIGLNNQSFTSHFNSTFAILQQDSGYITYINEEKSLKIVLDDEKDAVIWVIYYDPTQW